MRISHRLGRKDGPWSISRTLLRDMSFHASQSQFQNQLFQMSHFCCQVIHKPRKCLGLLFFGFLIYLIISYCWLWSFIPSRFFQLCHLGQIWLLKQDLNLSAVNIWHISIDMVQSWDKHDFFLGFKIQYKCDAWFSFLICFIKRKDHVYSV